MSRVAAPRCRVGTARLLWSSDAVGVLQRLCMRAVEHRVRAVRASRGCGHTGVRRRLWRVGDAPHLVLGEIRASSCAEWPRRELDHHSAARANDHPHLHHQRHVVRRRRRTRLVGRVLLARRTRTERPERTTNRQLRAVRLLSSVVQQPDCRMVHQLRRSSCTHGVDLDVGGVDLTVSENSGPWLAAPSGLWQAPGWVRGDVVLGFYGDSPSGLCGLGATINGQIVANSNSARNQTTWHQCAAPRHLADDPHDRLRARSDAADNLGIGRRRRARQLHKDDPHR